MPRPTICPEPGCPLFTDECSHGTERKTTQRAASDAARPNASRRGYGTIHRRRFRAGVLARNPWCVLCLPTLVRATEADHWPTGRPQLVAQGLDPDDPRHGRGLCKPHHSTETGKARRLLDTDDS